MSWLVIACLKNAVLALPLALAALAAGRLSRRPALAHVLWVLVLVKLITPPLIDVPVGWSIDVESWLASGPANEQPQPIVALSSGHAAPTLTAEDAPASPLAASSQSSHSASLSPIRRLTASAPAWFRLPSLGSLLAAAGLIWLAGCVVTASLLFARALRFDRFLRLAARRDDRLSHRVRQLSYRTGLVSYPKVVVVDGVVSPMLWGVGQGVQLVFPARLVERLGAGETDALLLHEMAHYARGDHWVRVLELAAYVAYWWNPIVWWACRQIESYEEQCCDAWVVEHQSGTRLSYAEALLATIDFLNEPALVRPPAACGLGEVSLLRLRLTQIMRGELAAQLPRPAWVLVLLAGLVLSPLEPAVLATAARRGESPTLAKAALSQAALAKSASSRAAELPKTLPPASKTPAVATPPATSATPTSPDRRPAPPVSIASAPVPPVRLYASAVSADGRYKLDHGIGQTTSLLQVIDGRKLNLNSHHFTCASFAPNSRTFVTGHDDGVLRQWDSQTGGLMNSLRTSAGPVTSVAWSPDGKRFASGSADGVVSVWEAATLEEVARVAHPSKHAISCVRWSPSGDRLAVSLGDWMSGDAARLQIWIPDDNVLVSDEPLPRPAGALAWLSDDALLVAAWNGQGTVHNLRGTSPDQPVQLDKDLVSAAAWSPDIRLVPQWRADQLAAGAGL